MGNPKGGRKLRRTSIKKGQYQQQFLRTASNKARRATKRAKRKAYWTERKAAEAKAETITPTEPTV